MSSTPVASTSTDADPRRDDHPIAVGDAARGQVVGMHQQVVPRLAAGEPRGVVHPRVAVLLVPPPDQQQLVGVRGTEPCASVSRSRSRSETTSSGARSIRLSLGLQPLGHGGLQRAEVDALGVCAQLQHGRPAAGEKQPGEQRRRRHRHPGLGHQPRLQRQLRTRAGPAAGRSARRRSASRGAGPCPWRRPQACSARCCGPRSCGRPGRTGRARGPEVGGRITSAWRVVSLM